MMLNLNYQSLLPYLQLFCKSALSTCQEISLLGSDLMGPVAETGTPTGTAITIIAAVVALFSTFLVYEVLWRKYDGGSCISYNWGPHTTNLTIVDNKPGSNILHNVDLSKTSVEAEYTCTIVTQIYQGYVRTLIVYSFPSAAQGLIDCPDRVALIFSSYPAYLLFISARPYTIIHNPSRIPQKVRLRRDTRITDNIVVWVYPDRDTMIYLLRHRNYDAFYANVLW